MGAGPSDGFLSKVFGGKKKRTEDIHLPNKREEREAVVSKEGREYEATRKKKVPESNGGGLFAKAKQTKEKYNPFDRFVKATSGTK